MSHFYGGAVPLHRHLKGLLLRGLPRGQIPTRESRGGAPPLPLDSILPELGPCRPVESVPDPVGQRAAVLVCRPLVGCLFIRRDSHVETN